MNSIVKMHSRKQNFPKIFRGLRPRTPAAARSVRCRAPHSRSTIIAQWRFAPLCYDACCARRLTPSNQKSWLRPCSTVHTSPLPPHISPAYTRHISPRAQTPHISPRVLQKNQKCSNNFRTWLSNWPIGTITPIKNFRFELGREPTAHATPLF